MKLYGPDKSELMVVSSLEIDGTDLVIRGKVFGAMPLLARLEPEQARAGLKLLSPRLIWFLLTLPWRRSQK